MNALHFALYAALGIILSEAGINVIDHPIKFFTILAIVVAIDIAH